jgi:hypothetical protein
VRLLAQVVPLYCLDPRQFIATPWGNPKTGNHRAQFLLQSVLDLKLGLQQLGSDLLVHMGKPEEAIKGGLPPTGSSQRPSLATHALGQVLLLNPAAVACSLRTDISKCPGRAASSSFAFFHFSTPHVLYRQTRKCHIPSASSHMCPGSSSSLALGKATALPAS